MIKKSITFVEVKDNIFDEGTQLQGALNKA
jgi:hypothetical protein